MKTVVIIGGGGIGKRHLRGFLKQPGVRVTVVEPHDGRRAEIARDYPAATVAPALAAVDLPACHAAVIGTPGHLHVAIARQCAAAGVPFLVEKPLSVTMEGVDELLAEVAARRLVARVGFVRRAAPETAKFRDLVRGGAIGTPRMCYINASQEFPKYRPDYQTTYYAKAAMGGGCLLDAASHMVDLLQWLLGPVREVSAMYDQLVLRGVECEDCCLMTLRFAGGELAQIAINQFQKPNVATCELIGTQGNLLFDMARSELRFADNDSGQWRVESVAQPGTPMAQHEARFAMQAALFLGAIAGQPDPLTTLAEARDNLAVILAAKQSDREKRLITVGATQP